MSTIASPSLPTTALPWRLIGRFVWKELRRMRSFALGVAGLALAMMLFAKAVAAPSDAEQLRIFLLLFPAFGGGAFVIIGAAITAFAVEREEQTDSFLYSLPRYPLLTFVGKLMAVMLLGILFTLTMSIVAWCVGGFRGPPADVMRQAVPVGLTLLVEATAWGLLVSLLVPRPLLAAVLACGLTSFSSQVAIGLSGGAGYQGDDYYEAIPARLALATVVLLMSAVLSRRWMLGTDNTWRVRTKRKAAAQTTPTAAAMALTPALAQQTLQSLGPATRRGIVWRLAWQTWRESWRTMLAVVAGGLLLMLGVLALAKSSGHVALEQFPLSLFFVPGLCGAMAFRQDHRRGQKQFLAEHAGRPRLVWLVRVAGWAAFVVLLWTPFAVVAKSMYLHFAIPNLPLTQEGYHAFSAELQARSADVAYYLVLNFSLATLTAFAFGQLASQLIKSEILAMGVSLLTSFFTLFYCMLIVTWRLPPMWCHLPIIIGCLGATYLRAPDWIAGRNTLGRWSGTVLAAVVPLVVVVLSVPAIRASQIDRATAQFRAQQQWLYQLDPLVGRIGPVHLASRVAELEEQQSAAEEVSRQYREVLQEIVGSQPAMGGEGEFSIGSIGDDSSDEFEVTTPKGGTPEQIDRLVELTKEPAVQSSSHDTWPTEVVSLLDTDARRALDEGELDLAWSRLLAIEWFKSQLLNDGSVGGLHALSAMRIRFDNLAHEQVLLDWASAPGQSAERLKQAAADLQAVQEGYPLLDHIPVVCYQAAKQSLDHRTFLFDDAPDKGDWDAAMFLDGLPGEHERAKKALDLLAKMSIDYSRRTSHLAGQELREQLLSTLSAEYGHPFLNDPIDASIQCQRMWQTADSSMLASKVWNSSGRLNFRLIDAINLRTELSLQRLRLALIAYHLDNGQYPETLRQLIPDYLTRLELDPYSREMFQYAPRIYEKSMWGEERWSEFAQQHNIFPLIWSVGCFNVEADEVAIVANPAELAADDSAIPQKLPIIGPGFGPGTKFETQNPSQHIQPSYPLLKLPHDDEFPDE